IAPLEGVSNPPNRCKRVDLPAPDSPTSASISPRSTSKFRFEKTTRSASPDLYRLLRSRAEIYGSGILTITILQLRLSGADPPVRGRSPDRRLPGTSALPEARRIVPPTAPPPKPWRSAAPRSEERR